MGNTTAFSSDGSGYQRNVKQQSKCSCTLKKQNSNGTKDCKVSSTVDESKSIDVDCIN